MNKQGLIVQKDFRETLSGIEEDLLKRGDVFGSMAGTIAGVIKLLDESPVIDPETLPIVRELRGTIRDLKDTIRYLTIER